MSEITEIYGSLSPNGRKEARKDLPKMLRILNMNDYNSVPVNIAVLTLMELLLRDHTEVFVSEMHGMFPKLQSHMNHDNRSLRILCLKFMGLLVTKVPYHLTEHFVYTSLRNERGAHPEIPLQIASLALLNTKLTSEEENMHSLIPNAVVNDKSMVGRIAKSAYVHIAGHADVTLSREPAVTAALDVISAALIRVHPSLATESSEDAVEVLVSDLLDTRVAVSTLKQIHQRSSELFFPSLLREPATTSLVATLIAGRHEERAEV